MLQIVETFKTILKLRIVDAAKSKPSWRWEEKKLSHQNNLGAVNSRNIKTILELRLVDAAKSKPSWRWEEKKLYLQNKLGTGNSRHIQNNP